MTESVDRLVTDLRLVRTDKLGIEERIDDATGAVALWWPKYNIHIMAPRKARTLAKSMLLEWVQQLREATDDHDSLS